MIQEYLVQGEKRFKDLEKYMPQSQLVSREIAKIQGRKCWTFRYSLQEDSEWNASILSELHQELRARYQVVVLTDGSAEYFTEKLYPYFNTYERRLRKLLYLKGAACGDHAAAAKLKDLEEKNLTQMQHLLFTDENFEKAIREAIKQNPNMNKEKLTVLIQSLKEELLWDKLMGENELSMFQKNFSFLKLVRNRVMHAQHISLEDFNKARGIVREINSRLNQEIAKVKMDVVEKNPPRAAIRKLEAGADGQQSGAAQAVESASGKKRQEQDCYEMLDWGDGDGLKTSDGNGQTDLYEDSADEDTRIIRNGREEDLWGDRAVVWGSELDLADGMDWDIWGDGDVVWDTKKENWFNSNKAWQDGQNLDDRKENDAPAQDEEIGYLSDALWDCEWSEEGSDADKSGLDSSALLRIALGLGMSDQVSAIGSHRDCQENENKQGGK